MTKEVAIPKKIVRSSIGLRDALFDELDALREGKSNPQRASAMAKLAVQVIGSVRIEIDHHRYVSGLGQTLNGAAQTTPLQLGTAVEAPECEEA